MLIKTAAESGRALEARRRWLLEGGERAGANQVFPGPGRAGRLASALPR